MNGYIREDLKSLERLSGKKTGENTSLLHLPVPNFNQSETSVPTASPFNAARSA